MTSITSPPSSSNVLETRAQQFTDLLRQQAFDDHDILWDMIHYDHRRPLRRDELDEDIYCPRGIDPVDFYPYEDSGIALGSLLISQAYRYAVTSESDALDMANQALRGIRYIYQLGTAKCPGYFPKPYAARISEQISRDQYLFVMCGLDLYLKHTPAAGHAGIVEMITTMAAYWIDCDYTTIHYDLPPINHLEDWIGSLYLGLIQIAAAYSDDPKFDCEYQRLRDELSLGERSLETLRSVFRAGHTYDGGTVFRQQEHGILMKTLAVDQLWDLDPERRSLWRDALRCYRDDDLWVTHNPETRLNYFLTSYDAATDTVGITEPGTIAGMTNPLNLATLTFGGRRQSPGSVKAALAAILIADRLNDPNTARPAWEILRGVDLAKMRLMTVPDDSHIPPHHTWHTRSLYTGGMAQWLAAYWAARFRGPE